MASKYRGFAKCLGVLAAIFIAFAFANTAQAQGAPASEDAWSDLKGDVFGDRPILDGADKLAINAPNRVHDPALVPIAIIALQHQKSDDYIKSITLVIDKNPAPVAAIFHLGPESGSASLSTHIRVKMDTHTRAIAETNDGKLYMVSSFIKASGGFSEPAGKNRKPALASIGKMKLHQYSPIPGIPQGSPILREAQLMIRHPNNSGLQMDKLTGLNVPAHFIRKIEVWRGKDRVLAAEGTISLSENPSIRFHFFGEDNEDLSVSAVDTKDNSFTSSWKIDASGFKGGKSDPDSCDG